MPSGTAGELQVPIRCEEPSGNYPLSYLTNSHILYPSLRERFGITATSRISTVMGCVVL
jgi:hypothetical protein